MEKIPHFVLKTQKFLNYSVFIIGSLSVVLLVVLSVLGIFAFWDSAKISFLSADLISPAAFVELLDRALLIFIAIELLNIALAIIQERDIVHTVFEALLVAIARKIIVSGTDPMDFEKSAALSMITLAIALSWWLVNHSEISRKQK